MVSSIPLKEEIITGEQYSMVGILTYGASTIKKPAIVIFNAGLIHKIGPNRMHVKLARKLAAAGYNVFRFDYGGQGDSIAHSGQAHGEGLYVTKTLDLLAKKTGFNEFVLVGICSGAEDAYTTALQDDRIKGIVMVNGTGLDIHSIKQLYPDAAKQIQLRYYKKSLLKADRWLKVLRGKSKALTLGKFNLLFRRLFRKRQPANKDRHAEKRPVPFEVLKDRNVALLLVLAEGSTAFDLVQLAYNKNDLQGKEYVIMKNVDHTITPVWAQNALFDRILQWCNSRFNGND